MRQHTRTVTRPLPRTPARSLSWASACALLACSCGSEDTVQLRSAELEQQPIGTLALALSSSNGGEEFRLVGSITVLDGGGQFAASVDAALDSPATQSIELEPGLYLVSIADGYSCTYFGPTPGFSGCSFVRASPNPFEILSGQQTSVTLEVTLHFDQAQPVTALLRSGAAEFRLAPSTDIIPRCGSGPGCDAGHVCASLDGAAARCHTPCSSDADCSGSECVSVFAADPAAASPSGICVP
jgi:hypothetical protein